MIELFSLDLRKMPLEESDHLLFGGHCRGCPLAEGFQFLLNLGGKLLKGNLEYETVAFPFKEGGNAILVAESLQ